MPVFDAHKNLAISAVATAPSPATSGTSLVVTTGQGTRFPAVPFNATIWPTATQPDPSNAEVVRVTAVATDTLTIVRAQEGTSARTVVVTDQIAAGITAKTSTDIETALNGKQVTLQNPTAASILTIPGAVCSGTVATIALTFPHDFYLPFFCEDTVTFDQVVGEITFTTASAGQLAHIALYNADATWQPTGTLIEDFGTVAIDSTGLKTVSPAAGTRKLPPGRYVLGYNGQGSSTWRSFLGNFPGGMALNSALGASPYTSLLFNSRSFATFPSTPTAWAGVTGNALGMQYFLALRVTAVGT